MLPLRISSSPAHLGRIPDSVEGNSHRNSSLEALSKIFFTNLKFSPKDLEKKQIFFAIPFLLHELLSPQEEPLFFDMIKDHILENERDSSQHLHNIILFLNSWVSNGRPLSFDLLCDIKVLIRQRPESDAKDKLLRQIDLALKDRSETISHPE